MFNIGFSFKLTDWFGSTTGSNKFSDEIIMLEFELLIVETSLLLSSEITMFSIPIS